MCHLLQVILEWQPLWMTPEPELVRQLVSIICFEKISQYWDTISGKHGSNLPAQFLFVTWLLQNANIATYWLEVYIGSDINGQPDPTKYPTNPTRYPNGENRTTRTRPDSVLSNPNPTRPEVSNYISWPTTRILPEECIHFIIWTLQS